MTSISRRNFLAGTLALTFMSTVNKASAQTRITIATSMPIVQDIVANIAGDAATVFSIMPDNADPHTWEANPEDMIKLEDANAFVYIGKSLEPFVESGGWRRTIRDNGTPEFAMADHVELITSDEVIDHGDHVHDMRAGDPHIWLDPQKIIGLVPELAAFLAEVDAPNADTYTANAETYKQQLTEVDENLASAFEAIPDDRRKMVVFHDAWQYFAARYHFEIIGIVLENPDGEASAQDMVQLLGTIEDSGINVVFAEPQFNTSVLDVLKDEGGIEIVTLLTDSFAGVVDSYVGLLEYNRDQIVSALGE